MHSYNKFFNACTQIINITTVTHCHNNSYSIHQLQLLNLQKYSHPPHRETTNIYFQGQGTAIEKATQKKWFEKI